MTTQREQQYRLFAVQFPKMGLCSPLFLDALSPQKCPFEEPHVNWAGVVGAVGTVIGTKSSLKSSVSQSPKQFE